MTGSAALPHAAALAAAQVAEARLRQAYALAGQAVAALSTPLQTAIEDPLNAPAEDPSARHRRLHKRGVLSRIEADPALRAFILARIDTMTFAEVITACAATFPPDRRPSPSGLHRWWHRHGKTAAQPNRQISAVTT